MHHAYSKNAEVTVPSLDDWEKQWQRKTEGGGGKAESRKLKAEIGPEGTDDGGQRTEDGGRKTDVGGQRSAVSGREAEIEMPKPKLVPVDFQARAVGGSDAGRELDACDVAPG